MRKCRGVLVALLAVSCSDRLETALRCTDVAAPAAEVPADGLDNDCDGRVDEGRPDTRAHCGAWHHPCALGPDDGDVRCEDGRCVGVPRATPPESSCFDGLDDDGDGIRDDGPACEALVANAATPECDGRRDDPGCPPTAFTMGSDARNPYNNVPRSDERPRHLVYLTYDYFVDRYEATRTQLARFLRERHPERCGGATPDPRCEVAAGEERLPAGGMSWCEAAEYCAWAGKRLPTEAEWERMARGTDPAGDPRYPWDGTPADLNSPCRGSTPVLCDYGLSAGDCCRHEPWPVDDRGGWARVGGVELEHVGGNAWEWVYDAYRDGYPAGPLTDPVVEPDAPDADRTLRGGGYDWQADSARTSNRVQSPPTSRWPSYGVRCARDADPVASPVRERVSPEACRPPELLGPDVAGRAWTADALCIEELAGTPIIRAFFGHWVGDPVERFTVAVEPARITAGVARHDGARLRWRGDLERAASAADCADGRPCAADAFAPPRQALEIPIAALSARMSLQVVAIEAAAGSCLAKDAPLAADAVPVRLHLALRGDVARTLSLSRVHVEDWLCALDTCGSGGLCCAEPAEHCKDCPRWDLTLDASLRPEPLR
jgi:formylglycine-generating enzyme required for sulfatase activity